MVKRKPLTEKQQAYRKRLLAQVHLSKKYTEFYAYYEEDYRAMLQQHFSKTSAAQLSIDELRALVDFLNERRHSPITTVTPAQLSYILNRWRIKAQNPSDNALRQLCQRLFGVAPLRFEHLSKTQASGLINVINRL